jgi:hypothetical protein
MKATIMPLPVFRMMLNNTQKYCEEKGIQTLNEYVESIEYDRERMIENEVEESRIRNH